MKDLAIYLLLGILPEAVIYTAFLVVSANEKKGWKSKSWLLFCVYA